MLVEGTSRREIGMATHAHKGSLLCVYGSHVIQHITLLTERFPAPERTQKRFLPRVGTHVKDETSFLREILSTELAMECLLLRGTLCCCCCCVADGFGGCVCVHVNDEGTLRRVVFTAYLTFERTFASVYTIMVDQVPRLQINSAYY